ncbi:MAG: inositol monophosphatase [Vulcanisaeta sp.]|nr:inositol monophosphatase [Vulcanisaeta sp.]MCG2869953.1 inositol monophosphatase [Vulcanisaeta sp.]MCG2887386.1 inositol monophosphatase [Vulcanisaeta sp.]
MEVNLASLIIDLAVKAGAFIRSKTRDSSYRQIMRRSSTDVSRRIDLEAEDLIIRGIESEGLRAVVITEERGLVKVGDGDPEYEFIVDPLDGSLNFVFNIPFYSVSIAAGRYRDRLRFDDLSDGVVYYVDRDAIYYGGTEGLRVRGDDVDDVGSHIDVPVVSMYVEPNASEDVLLGLREFYDRFGRFKIRTLGSASLEVVMASLGRFLAFVDLRGRLRAIDIAGAYVVSRAAGAHSYVPGGGRLGDELVSAESRYSVIVSRRVDVIDSLLRLIGPHRVS